jgi:hypothetical protein
MEDSGTIIIATNKDSSQFFSTNSSNNFVSLLCSPIDIHDTDGIWKIGLKQIILKLKDRHTRFENVVLDVFLAQASGCILKSVESNLLKRAVVFMRRQFKVAYSEWDNPDLVALKPEQLDRLEFDIKTVVSEGFSFDDLESVALTLVIKKFRK